ncbi:hypothetical protein L207DRAFT_519622 [Hyaloscypha variabilis F]|uniref:Uncharacterized protein n=1 Tax=Hyaloscypha variabilis (strain UAMH 11265 / GT02V1 / F) TaxID=1149755 RepID=A0A2J6QXC6_HYAVF|nr:hypothetical protein L207DRAFT_519622 [Hyaloscypha variabilis F]
MDEFAQSREDDDLFADEFEPVTVPTVTLDETPAPSTPAAQPANVQSNGGNVAHRNGRKEGQERRQRGGRGGAGGTNNGLSSSRYAPKVDSTPAQAPAAESTPAQDTTTSTSDPAIPPPSTSNPAPAPQNAAPNTAEPTPPTAPTNTRTPAVRGDRSATGGPAHKKLTEEELTLKLEKMAILNAQKAERHRLSEADQAAFQHREKELAKERREKAVAEKRNERVMEMERAKNRERKMKAQGGREWDSEKVESDIVDRKGRSSEYVRGGHGGVIRGRGGGLAGSRFATEGDEETAATEGPSSRGRGTFEIRGRGRGGRGGRGGKASNTAVPTAEDFPSLPTPKAPTLVKASDTYANTPFTPAKATSTEVEKEQVKSPDKPAGDWAEEMATPIEEKKLEI